jgi:hypothetical protein
LEHGGGIFFSVVRLLLEQLKVPINDIVNIFFQFVHMTKVDLFHSQWRRSLLHTLPSSADTNLVSLL